MHNIQIKTKVITNRIIGRIRELTGKTVYTGIVSGIVREILADDDLLDALLVCEWDEELKKGVCPFTPEQLLELAPGGFNPCPIDRFISGDVDLKHAIEFCFQQTFFDAWDDESWEENIGKDLEEIDYDLFQVTYGERTEEQWLATDKDGNALNGICPDCREKLKVIPGGKQVKN